MQVVNSNVLRKDQMRLLIGQVSKEDYLASHYSQFIRITDYINNHYANTAAINYWNHNAYLYLENGNKYVVAAPATKTEYTNFLKENKISLLAIDKEMEPEFVSNPSWAEWRTPRLDYQNYLLKNARLVFSSKQGDLYEVAP